jgi:hypothetical protein
MHEGDPDVALPKDLLGGEQREQTPSRLEHAMDLVEDGLEVIDMLEHLVGEDQIEGGVGEVESTVPDLADDVPEEAEFLDAGPDVATRVEDLGAVHLQTLCPAGEDDLAAPASEVQDPWVRHVGSFSRRPIEHVPVIGIERSIRRSVRLIVHRGE